MSGEAPDQTQQQQPQYVDQAPQPFSQPAPQAMQPAGNQQKPTSAPAGETGCNLQSFQRVFTSIQGILRAAEWLFAIVAFGATANVTGYNFFSQFSFVVAMGVITWIYIWIILVCYIFDFHSQFFLLNSVELGSDALLAFMNLIAGAVAAGKCNESIAGTTLCASSAATGLKAGAAFAILLSLTLMVSCFFSFRKWRVSRV